MKKHGYMEDEAAEKLSRLIYSTICECRDEWTRKALTAVIFGDHSDSDVQYFNRRINPEDREAVFPAPALAMLAHLIGTDAFARFFSEQADGFFTHNPRGRTDGLGVMQQIGNLFMEIGFISSRVVEAMKPESDGGVDITASEADGFRPSLSRIKQIVAAIETMLPVE